MSQFTTSKEPQRASNTPKWSIRDTEFLLRLIMSSKIDGADLEDYFSTTDIKIKDITEGKKKSILK